MTRQAPKRRGCSSRWFFLASVLFLAVWMLFKDQLLYMAPWPTPLPVNVQASVITTAAMAIHTGKRVVNTSAPASASDIIPLWNPDLMVSHSPKTEHLQPTNPPSPFQPAHPMATVLPSPSGEAKLSPGPAVPVANVRVLPSPSGEAKLSPGPAVPVAKRRPSLMVAIAAGLGQLDDVLVVINSAMKHAADPSRLLFRVVTMAAEATALIEGLASRLPRGVNLEAATFDAWVPRVSRLIGGKSSGRKELFDVLNFAAFYLHEVFPSAPQNRVLYLDVDVVVLADIAEELAERSLDNKPVAVSGDCSQYVRKYIDFEKLKKKGIAEQLPMLKLDKNACVFNRGVVMVDTKRWQAENITGVIEALVQAHLTKGVGPLWRSGVSQPPFLLAVTKRYYDLGVEYNVRGLGRGDIGPEEVQYYKKQKVWTPYLDRFVRKCKFHCCDGCKGWSVTPYVSANAHKAKILHFNGKNKPSKAGKRSSTPLQVPPKEINDHDLEDREQRPLCSCGDECVQECAGIWWKYLPPA